MGSIRLEKSLYFLWFRQIWILMLISFLLIKSQKYLRSNDDDYQWYCNNEMIELMIITKIAEMYINVPTVMGFLTVAGKIQ